MDDLERAVEIGLQQVPLAPGLTCGPESEASKPSRSLPVDFVLLFSALDQQESLYLLYGVAHHSVHPTCVFLRPGVENPVRAIADHFY